MASKYLTVKPFSEEEIRLRKHMLDLKIKMKDLSAETGIAISDVSKVIKGISPCPRYIATIYEYLGLEMPEKL